ncbi:MAG: ABC transporter permease [Saprospiraceae bacterium]|nr:ABC transporter permease [Saprospiraceae bacterium]
MKYKQFWTERKLVFLSLHLMVLTLFFSTFLTGNKPIVCKYQGTWYFPAYQTDLIQGSNLAADLQRLGQMDYRKLKYEFSIWPLFKNDATKLNLANAWLSPGTLSKDKIFYSLGTYDLGRDLFSGCVVGLSRSLWLSLISILLAAFAGIMIGSFSVYQTHRMPLISVGSGIFMLISCLILVLLGFVFVEMPTASLVHYILLAGYVCFFGLALLLIDKNPKCRFSLDRISLGYVEIMKSIPALLFLLIMVQIFIKPGSLILSLILAFLYTPIIVKYSRTYTYKIISEPFLDALAVSGAGPFRIYLKHVLPKVSLDIFPVLTFGVANIILLESSLSFLGLGLPIEDISLGNIMSSARTNPSAWWAVLFPGLIVFWLVTTLNGLGAWLSKRKDAIWVQQITSNS